MQQILGMSFLRCIFFSIKTNFDCLYLFGLHKLISYIKINVRYKF